MAVAVGTIVVGLVWETRRSRSPLSRVAALLAHHDPERLVGTARPPPAWPAAAVGRVRARLSDLGPMQIVTAWAVRAVTPCGGARRAVPCATTACRVWGADACAATQEGPCRVPEGESTEPRPALQPCGRAMRGGARAVPRWGTPEEGQASDTTRPPPRWSAMAPRRARHGGAPGASLALAAAALGTEDQRTARGNPWCLSRVPAPSTAGARAIAAAVPHEQWDEGGLGAPTTPPRDV
jgi:hypothetical protein